MAALRLSLSCSAYDRTVPILMGLVQPEGIDLVIQPTQGGGSTLGSPDADVYELPLPAMVIRRSQEDTHRAIAVYPKRTFFHQLLLTHRDRPVERFEDFRGKRIGLLNWYQHALGVWLRGHLRESYGILPEEMRWFTERPSLVPLPFAVSITLVSGVTSPVQMLLDGDIDVLAHERAHYFLGQHPELHRVFRDYKEREATYFAATGGVPINHVLTVRKQIVLQNPWVAASLVQAFTAAKELALERIERDNSQVSSPWMDSLLEEQHQLLGRDLYPYGLARTRHEVERAIRYLHEQQLVERPMAVEEVFMDDG